MIERDYAHEADMRALRREQLEADTPLEEIEDSWEDDWAIWDDIDRNPGSGYDMPRPE